MSRQQSSYNIEYVTSIACNMYQLHDRVYVFVQQLDVQTIKTI